MSSYAMRACFAAAAGAALSMAAGTAASASGQAARSSRVPPQAPARALARSGARLWVKRYGHSDTAYSVAVSPSGKTVFVTGFGAKGYATVAYKAATGARRWVKNYGNNEATSVAVNPTGKAVYVTGAVTISKRSAVDYATVAYNAATGAQRWVRRYNGPHNGSDGATSLAVSPTGKTVFVTGWSDGTSGYQNYVTLAYNAYTGARRWSRRYGPASTASLANAVTVSPTGSTVYVTGTSIGTGSYYDYATVAYNAATGAKRWAKRYKGPGLSDDNATSIAVSPTSGTVFVTGYSGTSYATVAYRG